MDELCPAEALWSEELPLELEALWFCAESFFEEAELCAATGIENERPSANAIASVFHMTVSLNAKSACERCKKCAHASIGRTQLT